MEEELEINLYHLFIDWYDNTVWLIATKDFIRQLYKFGSRADEECYHNDNKNENRIRRKNMIKDRKKRSFRQYIYAQSGNRTRYEQQNTIKRKRKKQKDRKKEYF